MSTINEDLKQIIKTKTGLELYKSLHVLHLTARQQNEPVTYPDTDPRTGSGFVNKVLDITIYGDVLDNDPDFPNNWKRKPIPLSYYTDFNGWTFNVSTNNLNEVRSLFYLAQDNSAIQPLEGLNMVRRDSIDSGHFIDHPILKTGKKLLIIKDLYPWTYRNDTPDTYVNPPTPWTNWDFTHPFYRNDLLLVQDGIALNRPIASYGTMQSDPECSYVVLTDNKHVFKNMTMDRSPNCAVVINLLTVKLLDDVSIENVTVTTPANSVLTGDQCITLQNATNITVDQFSMNRTYCNENGDADDYGYGILMLNVWNSVFREVESGNSIWGFFGCRHVNTALLEDCAVNRFDIHCYGRDVTCRNCTFAPNPVTYNTTYHAVNRYASLLGNLIYENCVFDNFIPYFTDYAYNVYQHFDVLFRGCTFNVKRGEFSRIIELGFWGAPLNARQENVLKCAPNVTIEDCTITLFNNITEISLFFFKDRQAFTESVHNTSYVSIKNLTLQDSSYNTLPFTCFKETNLAVTYAQRVFRFKDWQEVSSF